MRLSLVQTDSRLKMPARCTARPGFSFAEILFAVMILGIGFIMVAAIFPVAIQQTAQSTEDSTATAVSEAAFSAVQRIASDELMPVTVPRGAATPPSTPWYDPGQVWSFRDNRTTNHLYQGTYSNNIDGSVRTDIQQREMLWGSIVGDLIYEADPRYGWVVLYRRGGTWLGAGQILPDSFAQIIVIVTHVRNRDRYTDVLDLRRYPMDRRPVLRSNPTGSFSNDPSTFEPMLLNASSINPNNPQTAYPSTIQLTMSAQNLQRAAPGAFVIISDDNQPMTGSPPGYFHGQYNGRILRLGAFAATQSGGALNPTFELVPGLAFSGSAMVADKALNNASVFIVGTGYADPTTPSSNTAYSGSVQDVAAFSRVIPIPLPQAAQ